MKIAIGSDHRGLEVVGFLERVLKELGHDVRVMGPCDPKGCDYPDAAFAVGNAVGKGEVDRGVLVCGSGIGMSMAANKVHGVRAALVSDELNAQLLCRHNDANVLCMSADMLGQRIIERIVKVWLSTEFEGGRHQRRVEKMRAIERGKDPGSVKD